MGLWTLYLLFNWLFAKMQIPGHPESDLLQLTFITSTLENSYVHTHTLKTTLIFKKLLIDFQKERKRESIDVRKKHPSVACLESPRLKIKPATQVCSLTMYQIQNLLVYGMMLQPPELPGQGLDFFFLTKPHVLVQKFSIAPDHLTNHV